MRWQLDDIVDGQDGYVPADAVMAVSDFLSGGPKGSFIDGTSRGHGSSFAVLDPGTGRTLCEVFEAGPDEVDDAVNACARALADWRRQPARARAEVVFNLAGVITDHADEFALLEALDTGKRFGDAAQIDVPLSADHFTYFAGWAAKIEGTTIPVSVPDMLNYTLGEPVGVVAGIIPWNYPLLFAAYKLAAPLVCGNAICLKPAEQTPLSALFLGTHLKSAGVPDGLVNILIGSGQVTGDALVTHRGVNKVAFTGSVETGKRIAAKAAAGLKRVSLELGGKSPNIVFDDAPVESAVAGAFSAIFFNHGQVCTAGSRLFVQARVYQDVLDGITQRAGEERLGHGLDPNTTMGPLVSLEQRERVAGYIETATEDGVALRYRGTTPDERRLTEGYFVAPAVYEVRGQGDSAIERDEIFGPVLAVASFASLEQVAVQANRSEYGLAAGVWTKDITRAHRLAGLLQAGTVWINTLNMFDAASPIGGFKDSGLGRELGRHSIDLYTEVKSVWVGLQA